MTLLSDNFFLPRISDATSQSVVFKIFASVSAVSSITKNYQKSTLHTCYYSFNSAFFSDDLFLFTT